MLLPSKNLALVAAFLAIPGTGLPASAAEPRTRVSVIRTPNGGIQPQAVADARGTIHLIYFKGEAGAGDLFYVSRPAGRERFTDPIRVNSRPKSAIAVGTVRGGQLVLGKDGRVHVAWNGSGRPREGLFYARLNDAGTAFEEQRNLMGDTFGLDGGGTVAADGAGHVFVAWHALKKGAERGEGNRQVWVARSTDGGKTFSREVPAGAKSTGVCACCSTRAFADSRGALYLLFRSATAGVHRDVYLLTSDRRGKDFSAARVHEWKVPG